MKIKEYLHIIAQQQDYIIRLLEARLKEPSEKKNQTTVYNFPTANNKRTQND